MTVNYGSEKHEYKCGDYNATYKAYYLMADGDVYLTSVNLKTYFSDTLEDLLARDSLPSADWTSRELVSSVTIRDGDNEIEITDADALDEYLSSLSTVYLHDYAAYNADEATKAAYGLDGSRSVTVNYRKSVSTTDANGNSVANYLDTVYTFLIGDPYGEDETLTAAAPASSGVVYLISAEKADGLLGRQTEND